MGHPYLKIAKRVLLGLLISLLLMVIGVFVILRFYEDEVVAYALKRINDQLLTKANIEQVDLTFWETFPMASLKFSDVYIQETFPEKDTLLFAEKLYLEFNLLDIISSNYEVKEIEAVKAKVYPKINEKGQDNWHFWKSAEEDTSQFKLDLNNIEIQDTRVIYEDRNALFFLDIYSENAEADGRFTDAQFDLDLDLSALVHELISGETAYAIGRTVELSGTLNADGENQLYTIQDVELAVEGMEFTTSGSVGGKTKTMTDLSIQGQSLDLEKVIQLLPASVSSYTQDYEPDGNADLQVKIKGESSAKQSPDITIDLAINEGSFRHSKTNVSVDNISSGIKYLFGKNNNDIEILSFNGELSGGSVSISGKLTELNDPLAALSVDLDVPLKGLRDFFAWDTLEISDGNISANASIQGRFHFLPDSTLDLSAIRTEGKAALSNAAIQLKGSTRRFENIQTQASLSGNDARIESLTGVVNGSDFSLKGSMSNLLPFLLQRRQSLYIDATFQSNLLDFTNLLESNTSEESFQFILPSNVDFKLNTLVKELRFKKFVATDVRGIAHLNNQSFRIDPVTLNTADGQLMAQVALIPEGQNQYQLHCRSTFSGLNIQKLFTEFGNFGQEVIKDEHLKGKATANIRIDAPLNQELSIDLKKLYCLIDISIENGELNELQALQDIAGYLEKNKIVAPFVDEDEFAEKMKHIKFSTLQNTIEIKDQLITIPVMDIQSSAMNITARGEHHFDNRINYSIGFDLRSILKKKNKDPNEVDDGLGKKIYIYMRGITDNPEFGLDKDFAKDARQQEVIAEKENIKSLLKEEFGFFKNDNSVGAYEEKVEDPGITTTIEWSEFDEKPKEGAPQEQPKKKTTQTPVEEPTAPKKKTPKWLQEKEEQEDE